MKYLRGLFSLLILMSLAACQLSTRLPVLFATPTHTATLTFTASATSTSTSTSTATATYTATSTFTPTASSTPTPTRTRTPTPTLTASPTVFTTPTDQPTPSPLHFRVFEELWHIVKQEYLYPDFNGLNWDKIHKEYANRIQAGLTDEDFYQAMHEMIERLGDEHSTYLSPAEAQAVDEEYAGSYQYVGIGVLVQSVPKHNLLTILLVFPGSPAEAAGLTSHDNILEVDGQPVLDENGTNRNLLRGPEGSQVMITVQTPGQESRQLQLTRQRIKGSMPVPHQIYTTRNGLRIGYLMLATFSDLTIVDKVAQALTELTAAEALDGIIIDNRPNTGGANTVLEGVLSYFTKGTVGYFVNRQEREPLTIRPRDIGGSQKIPLVVLVGPGTVSFGEIFAGVLKDLNRAYLVGENTAGNVEILYVYNLGDGSRAWLAHDTFRPLNQPTLKWEGTGVFPHLTVLSNWWDVTAETDPVIKAALSYFDIQH